MITDLCLLAIVVLLAGIMYIVWQGLKIMRVQHAHAMAALSSLGDTHKIGLEALSTSMQKMEQRIAVVEGRLNGRAQ